MVKNNIKFTQVLDCCFVGINSKSKFAVLLFFTLILFLPSVTQASGLFDFQMKLANKGNAEAQFKVGEMYETGFGVKEDKVEARSWITRAADQGHETASFKLLYWDIDKNGINDSNKDEYEALQAKAKSGNGQAQYYMGKMYAHGVGVRKSSEKAIKWLNKAALLGVLAAEQEMATVRDNRQRWLEAKQRADEKKRAELKVKKERERQVKLEQQRKVQAQKQAEAKAKADEFARKNAAAAATAAKAATAAAQSKASQKAAADKAKRDKFLAKKQAEQKQRETERQALLEQREADRKTRKTQFESDPCSGKSARFLSSCR